MTWTDQNGITYTFDDAKFTARINLSQYNGPWEIEIPRSIKYQDHDYSIVSFDNKGRCPLFKSIKFSEDSLVSHINFVFTRKISIPPLIEEVDDRTLCGIKDLNEIEFSEKSKLKSINLGMLAESQITNIFIPSSVTKIHGCSILDDFKNLQKIEFGPNSKLQKIERYTFNNASINTISIPSSVKEIDEFAFCNCKNLQTIEFPINSELKTIRKHAFSGTSIQKIEIPFQVENLDKEFFVNANQLITIDVAEDNPHYSVVDGLLLHHKEVLMFANRDLKTISIPSYIKEISNNAFENCKYLKEIKFQANSNLEIIQSKAFSKAGIEKIEFPVKLKHINSNAFDECTNLKSAEFPQNSEIYLIDSGAFRSSGIEKIEIPPNAALIGDYAFDNCQKLTNVEFHPNSKLLFIGIYAFQSSSITKIEIPSSVRQIGSHAFNKCENLQIVKFAQDSCLEYIEENTFNSASQLEIIEIPSKVSYIGKSAFENCKKLNSIIFDKDSELRLIGDSAFKNSSIKKLTVPPHVKRIDESSFQYCPIESITFTGNSKLKVIGKNAFHSCNIKDIIIPSSVQIIDDSAFYCSYLRSVKYDENSQLKSLGTDVFGSSKVEEISIPSQVTDIKEGCFHHLSLLKKIVIEKENKHFAYVNDGLLLYKENENDPNFDTLIFIRINLENIIIPSYVKKISEIAYINYNESRAKYLELSKGSELKCIPRNSINSDIRTLVLQKSLLSVLYFQQKYPNINNIGIIDEFVTIDKFLFFGFNNLTCVSLPNAKTIKIEEGCPKLKIIVPRDSSITGCNLEFHEFIKVPRKLLEENKFPSKKDEEEFLYNNLCLK